MLFRSNLLLLIEVIPYILFATLISIVSNKYNFFESVAIIFIFKWSFSIIDSQVEKFSYLLVGKQKKIDSILEILHKNQFPQRDSYNEGCSEYISGILLQPDKYSENVVSSAKDLELSLNKDYNDDYDEYLRQWRVMEEALNLYSPQYKAQGYFPPAIGRFDGLISSEEVDSSIKLLDAKNKAFKKILENNIDDFLVNLYLATKYYPSWSTRNDFDRWNFGVELVSSVKGKVVEQEADFVVFWFKKKKFKIGSSILWGINTKDRTYEDVQAIKLYFGDDETPLMELVFKKKLEDYSVNDFILIDVIEFHENRECLELLKIANELINAHNKLALEKIKA